MEIKSLADLFIADANYIRNHPTSATRVDDRYQFFMPVTLFSVLTGQAIATIYENSPIPPEVVFEFPSITLRQMSDWKLLPKSMSPATSLPVLAFTNVKLRVDAELRQITVTGAGSSDRLDLGIASLPIYVGTIHLQLYVPETGTPENLAAFLEGSLRLGQGVSVKLTLPRGFMDWYLSLQPGAVAKLDGGLADLAALTGMQIGTLLPEDLASVSGDSGFTLSELTVRFGSQINAISLSIKTPGWKIIRAEDNEPPRLAVQHVTIRLNFEFYGKSTVSGGIVALFNVFGVDVDVALPIPFDSSNWHLESHPNVLIPGLGDIVAEMGRIVGAGDLSLSMPPGLSDFGSLIVQYLKISFDPTTRAISDVSFRLSSANAWTLLYVNTVSLEEIYLNLSIANPLVADKRQVTGMVTGKISLGRFYLPVEVERLTAGSGWTLKIVYDDISVGLPDLMPLIGIKSDDFKQALPESLSIVNDVAVSGLSVVYDFKAGKLSQSSFQLELSEVWRVIPDHLEINSLNIFVEIDHPSDSTEPDVLAAMDTEIEIGGVGFDLTASNYNPTTDWVLVLKMREGDTINFKDLIGALLTPLLPTGYKLPPEFPNVICKEVALAVIPATKAFQARLTSDVTWCLPFAKTSFYFDNLRFDLSIGESPAPPATGTRPYTFAASGEFVIQTGFEDNALDFGKATITTTNTGADTVLTIQGIKAVNLPGLAQKLTTGMHTGSETWNSLVPAVPIEFATDLGTLTLDLLVNLTQNVFAMHGSSPKYGSVAFLTKKISDKDWGYCVAAKLAEGFTFASLLPELSVIDGVMTFKQGSAGIAYSSFDAKDVKIATASVPQFSQALTVGGSEEIKQGVNFYAALNFASATNGMLFGNVVTLLSGLENKPDLVVYGHIAKNADDRTNTSLKAQFTAKLGDFRVLDALDFHGVTFQYAKDSHTEITLTGDLKLTLDKGKPNEQVYPFHGDLKVTNTRADFALRTPNGQSIVNPLGMTGVTIRDLHLIFSHVYRTKTAPAVTTVQLGGKANFGTTTQFDGNLYVTNGKPLLVEVSLTQQPPLGIIALLASSAAGITYPTDYFDIKFMSGSAYYYKKADDTQKQFASVKSENNQSIERHDGFNLQTTLRMFDRTVALQVNVQSGGVTANGKMLESFDLDFIEFTDADFTGSPSLFLRVLQNEKAFGLKAGVKLFKERFATGELSIGKYSNAGADEAQIRGRIAYAGNIEMFTGTALSFTYSKSAGFKITDWPFKFDYPLEYAKLMNGFKKGGCSALVGMVFAKVVKTNFSVKPEFSSNATHYIVTLKGTYSVALLDAMFPFLEVSMPPIPILIDRARPFTLSSLPERIFKAIGDSAPQIVASILNDPAKFSAFIATVGLVNAAPGLIADLACNGGKDVAESAQAIRAAQNAKAAAEAASRAAQAAKTVAEAEAAAAQAAAEAEAAAAAAAGAGGGAAASAAAIAAAIAATAAAASAAALTNKDGNKPKPQDTPSLGKAHIASFTYDGNELVVSWQSVAQAAAYRIELLRGNDVVAFREVLANQLRTTFPANELTPGEYSVQVKANATNYRESVSDKASISALGVVTARLTCQGAKIVATWDAANPPKYEVCVLKNGHSISTTPRDVTRLEFDPAGPGDYTVQVRLKGDQTHVAGPWSHVSNTVSVPDAITVTLTIVNNQFVAEWSDVHAPKYEISLQWNNSELSKAEIPAHHHAFELAAPGSYAIKVRALGDQTHMAGAWSNLSNMAYVPDEVSVEFSYDFNLNKAKATWNRAFPAPYAEFNISLIKDGAPMTTTRFSGDSTTFDLVTPGAYTVKVQPQGDGTHLTGQWSKESAALVVPAELVVTLTHVGDQIKATWNDVHAETYEVYWFKDGITFITELYPTNSVTHSPQGPGVYTVEVRSLGTNRLIPGKWSKKSNALTRLSPPNVAFAYVQNETEIYVILDSDSEGYRMQLVKDEVPVGPIVTGAKSQPPAILNAKDLTAGEYRVQVSASSPNDNTIPSTWIIARNPIYKLAAPVIASMNYTAERVRPREIIVNLQSPVPNAELYCAQFVNVADGKTVGMIQRFRSPNNILLSFQDIPAGTYKVQIMSKRLNQSDGIDSTWNLSGVTIVVLKQVTINQVSLAGDMLMATWSECANATHYEVALGEEHPHLEPPLILHRVTPLAGQTKPPTMLKRPNTNLESGKTYQICVRPIADTLVGEWSASAPLKIEAPVKTQQSLSLEGGLALIPLAAPMTLDEFTVEVWLKVATTKADGTVFICQNAIGLFMGGGAMVCNAFSHGYAKAYTQPSPEQWHHLAVVYQRGRMQFYLDGSSVQTVNSGGSQAMMTWKENILVGGLQLNNSSQRFPGMLDELRIWSVARSHEEIQQSMSNTLNPRQQPSLLLYYNFDDGTGRELTGKGIALNLVGDAKIVQSDAPVTL